MLVGFTILLMLLVAYSLLQEGLIPAFCMNINILLAGLITFNFWEPIAEMIDPMLVGSFLEGYEDALVMILLFGGSVALLRLGTSQVISSVIEFPTLIQQLGSAGFGLLAGYLLAGFMICTFQTLPAHEEFLGFHLKVSPDQGSEARSYMPPDRVWLALMHRAGLVALKNGNQPHTFDPNGSFEYRYARFRRFTELRKPVNSAGELNP